MGKEGDCVAVPRDERRQKFLPYVRRCADIMGLKDWQIGVKDEAPKDNTIASVWMRYGGKEADVYLSDDFLGRTPEQQRTDIAHELTHLHFAPMDGMVREWLDDGKTKAYDRMFEYGIDAVGEMIAPFLPLPDCP